MALPAVGTIQYGTYTFGALSKSSITGRPVYDDARRTIKWWEWTVRVETIVQNNDGIDADLDSIRKALSLPGQTFRFTTKGFGTFTVNVGAAWDMNYGPLPQLLEWKPIGGGQAARVVWSCTAHVPQGCDNPLYEKGVAAFNVTCAYSINDLRLMRHHWTGYLEIPVTRHGVANRNPPDHVDKYRERINIPCPAGFKRMEESYRPDLAGKRLDFSITDEQIVPNGLPEGTLRASGHHIVRSVDEMATGRYTGEINARYTMIPGEPKTTAWILFWDLVEDRTVFLAKQLGYNPKNRPYLMDISVDQGLYEESLNISFTCKYCWISSVPQFLGQSGIWREVPRTRGEQWATKIAKSGAYGHRAFAGTGSTPAMDLIIDVCAQKPPPIQEPLSLTGRIQGDKVGVAGALRASQATPRSMPTPEQSWMNYECRLSWKVDSGEIQHVPLLPKDAGRLQNNFVGGNPIFMPLAGRLQNIQAQQAALRNFSESQGRRFAGLPPLASRLEANLKTSSQRRTPQVWTVWLVGSAIRAGYPIDIPEIVRIGGVEVKAKRQSVSQGLAAFFGDVPIYRATWILEYIVTQQPGANVGVPGNPSMGLGGS